MLDAKLLFKYFAIFFAVCCIFSDGDIHLLTFFLAVLQLTCQLYSNFIGFSISSNDFIHNIDHLIENLLDNRIAQAVTLQLT